MSEREETRGEQQESESEEKREIFLAAANHFSCVVA